MELILGITGGSGCGKSEFCRALAQFGATVVDADQVAREVVCPGEAALGEIAERFGAEYLLPDGTLNRKKLGETVFSDPGKLALLDAIMQPRIREKICQRLCETKGVRVLDAPLLIESGLHKICDRTVCVLSEKALRVRRIAARDGLSEQEALARIEAQKSDEYYVGHTDDVIRNDGTRQEMEELAEKYWKKLESDL